jgi:hypothetical protein
MGGAAGGGGIGGFTHGHSAIGARVIARRLARETQTAAEGMLAEDGIEVPKDESRPWRYDQTGAPKALTGAQIFWLGFLVGALVISVPWAIFWELT